MSNVPADQKNKVVLQTSDEGSYTVDRTVAEKSGLIKQMIEGELVPWPRDGRWSVYPNDGGWRVQGL
jgi:hypothetical protein